MSHSISRRAILGAAAAVPATALLPTQFASAATTAVAFTLNATVLDGGEQITSLTLHTAPLGKINAASLKVDTFAVHVQGYNPLTGALISSTSNGLTTYYDIDREVTGASIDPRGDITLDLFTLDMTTRGTLLYTKGTNVEIDLVYTITQTKPLTLTNKRSLTIGAFSQGSKSSPEVDAFSYGVSSGGMNYRLFAPENNGHARAGKHPLIVWLHGGGEGGMSGSYYTNESQLRANRGALGFATDWGQKIFGGAYVVAPQCISAWMRDGAGFAPQIKALIDELVAADHKIDPTRIHVLGCSNGGYMTLKMEQMYPAFFAAGVPICPGASDKYFSETDLVTCNSTPTWFVQSKDDATLKYADNTERAAAVMTGEIVTPYDNVTWNGISYPGHWSWIYVGHNDPAFEGQHLYQWMAEQAR